MTALLASRLGVPLTAADGALATVLMAGIVMDTATFAHPNATPRTLAVAAALVEAGAPLSEISRRLYRSKPDVQLRLFGRVLDRLDHADDGRVIWSTLLDSDLASTGTEPAHSEGIIDLLAQAERAEVAILFKELGSATRISVRTKPGGVDATVGTRVQPGHEYVVTGKRGTTTDLSFQMLGGEYTDDNVPVSQAAFDDRELDIAADGTFEWRVTPNSPSQLLVREVYNDWSAQRGYISVARTDTAGTAPPPLTSELIEKRYAVAGKQLVQRVKTWLQFPQWFYNTLPVNTMVAPRLTPGGLATQYSSVGHFDLTPEQALIITLPVTDAPYLGFQLGSLWYISLDYINHQTSLNGTQAQADPDGKIRIVVVRREPRRDELGRDTRTSQGLSAVPLAAALARA